MAVGTLAVGMTFIAGTFLTGIYLSTFSTERTIAAVAAEEAFAKMRIFGLDPNDTSSQDDRVCGLQRPCGRAGRGMDVPVGP